MKMLAAATVLIVAAASLAQPAAARSLDAIHESGTIRECANPNALPFASRHGDLPGFQIELGQALAKQLGAGFEPVWIIGPHQIRRVGCDIVLDAIADPEVQAESGLQLSKPYYRTGVVLAVRQDSPIASAGMIDPHAKIGVMIGSMAAMTLNRRGLATSTFAFEDEMLQALADKEIEGAAVSRAAAGYFNITHPGQAVRVVAIDAMTPAFSWDVAVGMLKPDARLVKAVDDALQRLAADGTISRIYARYGMSLLPPK